MNKNENVDINSVKIKCIGCGQSIFIERYDTNVDTLISLDVDDITHVKAYADAQNITSLSDAKKMMLLHKEILTQQLLKDKHSDDCEYCHNV